MPSTTIIQTKVAAMAAVWLRTRHPRPTPMMAYSVLAAASLAPTTLVRSGAIRKVAVAVL